jgi:hypothetical protein
VFRPVVQILCASPLLLGLVEIIANRVTLRATGTPISTGAND